MKMLCAIKTCHNSGANNFAPEEGALFHSFPTDRDVKAEWVEMAGLAGKKVTRKHFLRSRHFRESDYTIKRSGKKYLKVSAIPCEYVVYRTLPPHVASGSGLLNEAKIIKTEYEPKQEAAAKETAHVDQIPKVVVVPQPDYDIQMTELEAKVVEAKEPEAKVIEVKAPVPEYDVQRADQPEPNRGSVPRKQTTSKRSPDSTIGTIYDELETSVNRWEFHPDRYFGSRCPTRIFDENSQDVDNSEFDDRYRRELSMNPYPPIFELELNPHLADLSPPRSPEPVLPIIQAPGSILDLEENLPTAVFDLVRNQRKLDDIMKIMTHHKSSKKAVAAAIAEVMEARNVKDQLQSGKMTNYEQAVALITLQYRHIVKLELKYRKRKRMMKRVSTVLHRAG